MYDTPRRVITLDADLETPLTQAAREGTIKFAAGIGGTNRVPGALPPPAGGRHRYTR